MSAPQRIQLRRTKGWRKPEGAIVVSRPSRWGNPWVVAVADGQRFITCSPLTFEKIVQPTPAERVTLVDYYALSVGTFGRFEVEADELAELRGHDLACWCPPDQPCHADVLLTLANQP